MGGDADCGPGSREAVLLGRPAADLPDLAREASPVNHAHSGAPPFLLGHGDADLAVPHRQSARLAEALLAAGVAAEVVTVPGGGAHVPDAADARGRGPGGPDD
ncbi:prolyl oligopeptidase family serine peptidase [Pedococcus sp. P5_B7]